MSGYRRNLPAAFGWRPDGNGQRAAVTVVWPGTAHISKRRLAKSAKRKMASLGRAAEEPAAKQAIGVQCKGLPCN